MPDLCMPVSYLNPRQAWVQIEGLDRVPTLTSLTSLTQLRNCFLVKSASRCRSLPRRSMHCAYVSCTSQSALASGLPLVHSSKEHGMFFLSRSLSCAAGDCCFVTDDEPLRLGAIETETGGCERRGRKRNWVSLLKIESLGEGRNDRSN